MQRLILNQDFEILNVSSIECKFTPWTRSTLPHDKVINWAKAKVHVYSDSVSCLGKMYEHTEAHVIWEDERQDFQQSNEHRKLFGIDGEPTEFE